MGFAYLLYLNDAVAAPALELMRRLCQPNSRSLPHITVRYSTQSRGMEDLYIYETATVRSIDINSVGTFPSVEELSSADLVDRGQPKTVFLGVAADQLEALVYKPKYPDSKFHLTIYDGRPSAFSAEVFALLSTYSWALRVDLPSSSRLTRIGTGPDAAAYEQPPLLTPIANELWRTISGGREDIYTMSETPRLHYLDLLADLLHANLAATKQIDDEPKPQLAPAATLEQLPLWGVEEFHPGSSMLLPPQRRWARERAKEGSLFLTPPEVAREMVTAALVEHGPGPVDFGDPALGNGIFFATLRQLVPHQNIRSAVGVEIDATRASTVRAKWENLYVHRGDFVDARPDMPRSLVVANPPYLRFQKLSRTHTLRWAERLGRELNLTIDGRADLYMYFVLAAHAWMRPGAVACWILPTEFMDSHYGAALRQYLTTKVSLLRLHAYDRHDPKFDNAKVTSVILLFRNVAPGPGHQVSVSSSGLLEQPEDRRQVALEVLRASTRWSVTVRPLRSGVRIRAVDAGRVGDLLQTRRGIATGANAWFLLKQDQAKDMQVPRAWLKPVMPRARRLQGNVIEADENGLPLVEDFDWLIDLNEDMDTVAVMAPRFASYLREMERAVGQRTLLRSRKRFYRQEQVPAPPLFFSYMAPAAKLESRFFLNCSHAVILNNYLGLYPNAATAAAIEQGACTLEQLFDLLVEIEREAVVDEGRNYSRGLSKIEPSELAKVPLPPPALPLVHLVRTYAAG